MSNRTIFIWDVHWCYKELKLLIKKLSLKENDKVYFVGDYINKWPKSYKILKYLYKNKFNWVLWNHDLNFFQFFDWKSLNKNQKKIRKKLLENPEVLDYYKALPFYIETDNFILIHWWLNPKKTLEEHSKIEITTIREINWIAWYKFYKWDKKVIYGHWALEWINVRKNTIWIDSGCCYWKYLSAYILETWELIQQKALKTYFEIWK